MDRHTRPLRQGELSTKKLHEQEGFSAQRVCDADGNPCFCVRVQLVRGTMRRLFHAGHMVTGLLAYRTGTWTPPMQKAPIACEVLVLAGLDPLTPLMAAVCDPAIADLTTRPVHILRVDLMAGRWMVPNEGKPRAPGTVVETCAVRGPFSSPLYLSHVEVIFGEYS